MNNVIPFKTNFEATPDNDPVIDHKILEEMIKNLEVLIESIESNKQTSHLPDAKS